MLALLLALSMSGNAIHVADTGHGAHAVEHPEGDAEQSQEHFCFGAAHNCGCCSSVAAASTGVTTLPASSLVRVEHDPIDDDIAQDGVLSRIDRPPRG